MPTLIVRSPVEVPQAESSRPMIVNADAVRVDSSLVPRHVYDLIRKRGAGC